MITNDIYYYFSNKDKRLRYNDNRVIRKGITHKVKGDIKLCSSGLHASRKILDALQYAPDNYLWLVNLSGTIIHGEDKSVASEREYLYGLNIEKILWEFSRKQALINIEKIKPYTNKYETVIKYLNTGDKNLRYAAWSAARHAARYAARSAAESAAWSAAGYAVEYAAESARYAAGYAARHAARYAARHAARYAVGSARYAAGSAGYARYAARYADRMLEDMIKEELNRRGISL